MKLISAGILLIGVGAYALTPGLPAELQQRSLPVYIQANELFDTPGVFGYRDTLSLSHAALSARSVSMTQPLTPQNGRGGLSAALSANTYLHLDTRQTVIGSAEFAVGSIKEISMCNSIDYDLVAPYVLGDYTGGDLAYRRYKFSGGYNYRLTSRWSVGAVFGYRAEIVWRDVDPRIKTIVSDLDFSIGASFRCSPSRIAAISGAVRVYSQNCDLDFYNPANEINTLPFTGLGTYYKRFAGNTNKNSGNSGAGADLAVRWLCLDGKGLQLAADLSYMRLSLMLRNFNNLPLAYTGTYSLHATACYGIRASESVRLLPVAEVFARQRNGTENLFGTAAGASYNKIGSRSSYNAKSLDLEARLPVELKALRGYLTFTPSASYANIRESHVDVPQPLTSSDFIGAFDADYSRLSGSWLWSLGCGYSSNIGRIEGEASVQRLFGKVMAGISVNYRHCSYAAKVKEDSLFASIILTF